jgi:hypothetical protein
MIDQHGPQDTGSQQYDRHDAGEQFAVRRPSEVMALGRGWTGWGVCPGRPHRGDRFVQRGCLDECLQRCRDWFDGSVVSA